jgi:hypothetical protein
MLVPAVLFMLKKSGFLEYAEVDSFQCADFLLRVCLTYDVAENFFFPFGLEHLFADSRFENADVPGALKPFAEEGSQLPVNIVDFFSPFFQFLPMPAIFESAFRHAC